MTGNCESSQNFVTTLLIEISDILRVAQERQSGDIPAFVSPFLNTSRDVDLREIHCGWSRHSRQSYKQRGARGHVRVLHVSGHGSGISEILMVEEASNYRTIGEYKSYNQVISLFKLIPSHYTEYFVQLISFKLIFHS